MVVDKKDNVKVVDGEKDYGIVTKGEDQVEVGEFVAISPGVADLVMVDAFAFTLFQTYRSSAFLRRHPPSSILTGLSSGEGGRSDGSDLHCRSVLEVECTWLMKAKDTAVAELMGLLDDQHRRRGLAALEDACGLGRRVARDREVGVQPCPRHLKSLYPRVELDDMCDWFATDCDEETGMKYVNEAQGAAESVADAPGL
uniref:Uncharacterized protein n=1 Tax=Oryza brachyantha TaxID=4533 RepID=J3MKT1_ORYBR